MIERLVTQRACIDFAIDRISNIPGPVLELGLGKGRTYDYIRRHLPNREIFAFDKEVHAPKDCIPDLEHLLIGDFRETLVAFKTSAQIPVALVHADFGSEDADRDRRLASELEPLLATLVQPGAMILADRALQTPGWLSVPLPDCAGAWSYFIYSVSA
jgi:hypothetical protein